MEEIWKPIKGKISLKTAYFYAKSDYNVIIFVSL